MNYKLKQKITETVDALEKISHQHCVFLPVNLTQELFDLFEKNASMTITNFTYYDRSVELGMTENTEVVIEFTPDHKLIFKNNRQSLAPFFEEINECLAQPQNRIT